MWTAIVAVVAVGAGAALALALRKTFVVHPAPETRRPGRPKLVADAESEAERKVREALLEVKEEISGVRKEAEEDLRTRREEMKRHEERLTRREDSIEQKTVEVRQRESELQQTEARLASVRTELERVALSSIAGELERIGRLTAQEAKESLLVTQLVDEAKRDAMASVREIEQRAREEGEKRARKIVTIAIQRVATDQTSESTRLGVPAPFGRHEGAHHRPGGPEHPGLRGHHGRQPDHRRHP